MELLRRNLTSWSFEELMKDDVTYANIRQNQALARTRTSGGRYPFDADDIEYEWRQEATEADRRFAEATLRNDVETMEELLPQITSLEKCVGPRGGSFVEFAIRGACIRALDFIIQDPDHCSLYWRYYSNAGPKPPVRLFAFFMTIPQTMYQLNHFHITLAQYDAACMPWWILSRLRDSGHICTSYSVLVETEVSRTLRLYDSLYATGKTDNIVSYSKCLVGYREEGAMFIYAMVILCIDDLVQIPEIDATTSFRRLVNICRRVPIEMTMLICLRSQQVVVKDMIPAEQATKFFRMVLCLMETKSQSLLDYLRIQHIHFKADKCPHPLLDE